MRYVNLAMIVGFLGVHYPAMRWYTGRVLAGVEDGVRREIRSALAPGMRLLFAVWLIVCLGALGWLTTNGFSDEALDKAGGVSIIAFHLIWWPLVFPLGLKLQNELHNRGVERAMKPAGPVRTASLQPRTASSMMNPWMLFMPLEVGIAGTALVVWRAALYPPSEPRFWYMIVSFTASALFFLAAWSLWIRREISMSYPDEGPPELAAERIAAAESLRRLRVLGIYWLEIAASIVFFLAAAACIEVSRGAISGETLGIYGGLAGTAVGLAGGVFGVIASLRTHRLMRRTTPGPT